MTILCALSLCLLSGASTTPQDRAREFLQAVREQMVVGGAFRGSGGVPAIVYQNENGITMQSSRGPLSDMYFLIPGGRQGYVLSGATFSTARQFRKIDPALAFDTTKIPAMLNALALAAGLETNLQVYEIARSEDRVEVTADQTFHGIFVTPGSGVDASFDYETGQVLRWSAWIPQMPEGPPPTPADRATVRDRILYDLVVNRAVPPLQNVRVRPVVYVLTLENSDPPDRTTFATSEERQAIRERRARYAWELTSRSSDGGWADGYADYGSGRLLETMRIRSGRGGTPSPVPAAKLPVRGSYRILNGRKPLTAEGRLIPMATPTKVEGKAFGLVAGGVVVRAVYDRNRDVLVTSQGSYRPEGRLRTALRAPNR